MNNQHHESAQDLEALFHKAVDLHHHNRLTEACQCYRQILEAMPGSPLVNYNMGLALYEMGKYNEALQYYTEALRHSPGEKDLLYNYALCCQKTARYDDAIDSYIRLLSESPADLDSLYNLACCHMDTGQDRDALEKFLEVLEIDAEHTSALHNLACLLHKNGEFSQAEHYYTRLLQLQPNHQAAQHLLASIRGDTTDKAPANYVEEIFNNYSLHYDESLTRKLEYRLPKIARQLFDTLKKDVPDNLNTLDLGCGTGLSGMAFADVVSSLTGVDLSNDMIVRAKQKNIYNELYVEEIETYLSNCTESFDLILTFDAFPYIGELTTIFQNISAICNEQCHFCFSIEKSAVYPFELQSSGRFAHSHAYIQKICTEAGFSVNSTNNVNLRKERGQWLEGILYFTTPV